MPQKKDSQDTKTANAGAPEVPGDLLREIGSAPATKPAKKARAKTTKPAAEESQAAAQTDRPAESRSTNLDDPETDEAVKDIAVDESDTVLALQDIATDDEAVEEKPRPKPHWFTLIILLSILAALFLARESLIELYQSLNINL